VCIPTTCAGLGYVCGSAPDGRGAMLDCGSCAVTDACGVGGVAGQCSSCVSVCVPETCASQGIVFGPASDGCGGVINCGYCPGGGVAPGCYGAITWPPDAWLPPVCGGACGANDCQQLGLTCGRVADGCGGVVDCGACNANGTCPTGGAAGDCSPCVPKTCASAGYDCAGGSDGCGGTTDCGTCDDCIRCDRGHCGGVLISLCAPKTCADQGAACGTTTDGCGNFLDCGACSTGLTCAQGTCLPACM
jgi:hypothetical protein